MSFKISRRGLLQSGAAVAAVGALQRTGFAAVGGGPLPLEEVGYGQVTLKSAAHLDQMDNVR